LPIAQAITVNYTPEYSLYVYLYSYRNPRRPYHVDDLSYIMGIHPFEYDENDKVLAVVYPQFFIDFIKTAKPREGTFPFCYGLVTMSIITLSLNSLRRSATVEEHFFSNKIMLDYDEHQKQCRPATTSCAFRCTSSESLRIQQKKMFATSLTLAQLEGIQKEAFLPGPKNNAAEARFYAAQNTVEDLIVF
uniref:COesterase domain-containing protein n=1 Tax=Angiostrongylus cantonensis TaxID=6313 RepID=A0A0K0CXP2_ANGCA